MPDYYWYEGKKISLEPLSTHRAIRLPQAASLDARRSIAAAVGATSPQSTGLDLGNGIILY